MKITCKSCVQQALHSTAMHLCYFTCDAISLSLSPAANEPDGKLPASSPAHQTDLFSSNRRESQRIGTSNRGTGMGQRGTRKSSLRRTSSRDGESSPSHNVVQMQLDAFANQLTVDEALTTVSDLTLFSLEN